MLLRYAGGIALAILLTGTSVARSTCTIDNYDQTPPPKLSGVVAISGIKFEWASDFDQKNGVNYVWHYIKNAPTSEPLNFNWKKAGLRQEFVRPLPPGEAACTQYPIVDLSEDDIDDDAPIIYGHANIMQRAAIYAKETTATPDAQRFTSNFSSSYVDDFGEKRDFWVSIFYDTDGDTVEEIGIVASKGLYVGIADVKSFWSNTTIDGLAKAAKIQKEYYDFKSLPSFATYEKYSDAFFADLENRETPATIVQGAVKFSVADITSGASKLAKVVVFDERRNPIASMFAALPVTKADR